jgi:hypothetical protein
MKSTSPTVINPKAILTSYVCNSLVKLLPSDVKNPYNEFLTLLLENNLNKLKTTIKVEVLEIGMLPQLFTKQVVYVKTVLQQK